MQVCSENKKWEFSWKKVINKRNDICIKMVFSLVVHPQSTPQYLSSNIIKPLMFNTDKCATL